jgi:hypothetical protein
MTLLTSLSRRSNIDWTYTANIEEELDYTFTIDCGDILATIAISYSFLSYTCFVSPHPSNSRNSVYRHNIHFAHSEAK